MAESRCSQSCQKKAAPGIPRCRQELVEAVQLKIVSNAQGDGFTLFGDNAGSHQIHLRSDD